MDVYDKYACIFTVERIPQKMYVIVHDVIVHYMIDNAKYITQK